MNKKLEQYCLRLSVCGWGGGISWGCMEKAVLTVKQCNVQRKSKEWEINKEGKLMHKQKSASCEPSEKEGHFQMPKLATQL